jgi:primase-polymerase (primpol)-like protein
MTYEAAMATGEEIGFVLTMDDPYFCIDIDNCYDPVTRQWSPKATQMFNAFKGAYMELSFSGTGLHIMGKCDKQRVLDRATRADGIEFYIDKRFIALGRHFDGAIHAD